MGLALTGRGYALGGQGRVAREGEHGAALSLCSLSILQPLLGNAFSVLAELRRCGLSESETCLKSVTLTLGAGQTVRVSGCPLG